MSIDYPISCIAADSYRENAERGTNLYRAEDGSPWIYNAWPETRYTFEITHPVLKESEQKLLEEFYDQHIGDEVRWFNPRRQSWWRVRMVGPPRLSSMRSGLQGDVDMTLVGEMVDAPTNYTRPVVSGLHQIGQVISVSQGTWESEEPMQFEYQWLRNGEPIAGATDQNYTLVDDDLFNMISVRVTASSFGGSTSVETEPVMARLDAEVSWLYSDMAETIFVDVDGNTPATWGDPVGLIKDSSGNGNDFTQPTVTARPILRNDPPRLEFDLTDDNLTTTLPAIENGTVVIAGTNGIWIDDDYNFDGGTFSIGPTSYTNGPEGILTAIGDPIERGFLVINRQLSQRERDLVIQELKERGAPGVFGLASNVFSIDNATNVGAGIVVDTTEAFFARESMDFSSTIDFSGLRVSDEFGWSTGDYILVELDISQFSSGPLQVFLSATGCFGGDPNRFYLSEGFFRRVLRVSTSAAALRFGFPTGAQSKVSSVSFRKLELVP